MTITGKPIYLSDGSDDDPENPFGELEKPTTCTYCEEVVTGLYINEMIQSYSDEHFCGRFCEEEFHKNA